MPALAKISKPNTRSREQWAEVIGADWRRSIDSIIQTGRDLIAAKEELPHGEFMKLVEQDLPFDPSAARRLMAIAEHPLIGKRANTHDLPARLSVLFEISALSEEEFADAEEKGLITPSLKVKPARAIVGAYNKPEGEIIGGAQHMLLSAKEAREIARATGRFVAAADGNIYSGSTEEEGRSYASKRDAAFKLIEAINALGDAPDAAVWFKNAERHWFHDFRLSALDDAMTWLGSLKEAMGVVDA